MPVSPTYPGVYVEELPSAVHTITGVSTSVTAFIGYFRQGPMNKATRIFSVSDLERTFGPLWASSEASYGVRQFFANGGSEGWVVRVAGGTPAAAAIAMAAPAGGAGVLTATASSEGTWGANIRLAVDNGSTDPHNLFNLTITLTDGAAVPRVLATEVYRNMSGTAGNPNNVVDVVNGSSALVHLSAAGSTFRPAPTGTVSIDLRPMASGATGFSALAGTTMDAALNGNHLGTITFSATAPASIAELAAEIQSQLRAIGATHANVSVVGGATTKQFLQVMAGTANPADIIEFTNAAATTLGLDAAGHANVQQYVLGASAAAGAQVLPGTSPTAAPGDDGSLPDATALTNGLSALDPVDVFNLLCIPDTMNLDDTAAFAVISAAQNYCEAHWAFLVVDVPQSATGAAGAGDRDRLTAFQTWLDTNATLSASSYSAVYYPRPLIPDPANGYRLRAVAPSGTIAGLCARIDSNRGVWKSPAGTEAALINVSALTYKMSDAENGVLNPLGVNCLRTLPVYGNVSWGARTFAGADQIGSDWKYVAVRRTALFIEASLYQGTQWVVFEPNDEPLWSQVRLNVGSFMRGLFRQGAFQGSTPGSAYFVKCDAETTTQADINNGVVNILVGFAPLKPAEFVILQIQQIAGQIPT